MLFDSVPQLERTETEEERAPTTAGRALVFDWETGAYEMAGGSPAEATGAEAVKAWIAYVARTRPGRYAIHPGDFGCSAEELLGKKIPKGYALSELRRELTASAAYCQPIGEISELIYDGEKIRFTVTLADGNKTEEVIDRG